jgi:hypothetical protein
MQYQVRRVKRTDRRTDIDQKRIQRRLQHHYRKRTDDLVGTANALVGEFRASRSSRTTPVARRVVRRKGPQRGFGQTDGRRSG